MRAREFHLGPFLMLACLTAVLVWGCQGPEAFYREDAAALQGEGGRELGVGGMREGTGGSGTGGMQTTGTGGKIAGTGGAPAGTGGMAMGSGGRVMGTGGRATGTGGSATGTGGMMTTGTGGMAMKGTGGATGMTPCAGICSPSITMQMTTNAVSNVKVTTEVCYENTSAITHANCSSMYARSLIVNSGTAHNDFTDASAATCGNFMLPAPRNGGYCFQVTAGTPDYAGFTVY